MSYLVKQMIKDKRVVLASASPRRRELLKLITDDFEIVPADIDENSAGEADLRRLPEFLSYHKCRKAAAICSPDDDTVVIGGDTVVISDGRIFGKPSDEADAIRMLCALSGDKHEVISGVTIYYRGEYRSFSSSAAVEFYELSLPEIEEYVRSGEPFGKAGAYAVQGLAGLFVRSISGDYNTVVGLPVPMLARKLAEIFQERDKGLKGTSHGA